MKHRLRSLLLSAVAMLIPLVVIGCQHVPKYEYTPSVQQVSPAGADKNLGVETFVTLDELTGGTKEGKKGHIQFRLRVENRGSSSVKLLPDRIDLISDDLNEFGTPEVEPSDTGSLTVKPSGSLLVTVTFSLPDATEEPAEQYRQFTLMWSLNVEDRTYSNSTTFKRQRLYSERRYRDPYWYHRGYYYDDYPYYRHPYHSRYRFHMGHSYHW